MTPTRTALTAVIACTAACLVATVPASQARTSSNRSALPGCRPAARFAAAHFPAHPVSHNRWLSLVPGTVTVLRGRAEGDDGKMHPHRIVSQVSRVTKVLDGVRTRVVFERDFQNGVLQESELAFEAEDRRGRVWNVGEYPEQWSHHRLDGAPDTWIAGLRRARAGLGMRAVPRVGTPAYLQGIAPAVEFHDCARVASIRHRLCLPARCFGHVLVIREWAPNDPEGGVQLKFYAHHVGAIRVGQLGGGSSAEELHVVHHARLSAAALARVDRAVLRQDRRGYHVSPHLYGRTRHAQGHCAS